MKLNGLSAGVVLLISSAAMAKSNTLEFQTTLLNQLKAKTVTEVFCTTPTTYQLKTACDDLKKSPGAANLGKVIDIEFESKSALIVRSGRLSVKVARTKNPLIFTVNQKEIDISEYQNIETLQEAVAGHFPKFSVFSLLLNTAYAQVNPEFTKWGMEREMAKTIALMMISASDDDICQSAAILAKTCLAYPSATTGAKSLVGLIYDVTGTVTKPKTATSGPVESKRELTRGERIQFDQALATFNSDISKMSEKMGHLQRKKQDMLKSCRSIADQTKSALDDLKDCQAGLRKGQQELQKISSDVLDSLRGTEEQLGNLMKSEMMLSRPPGTPPAPPPAGTR